MVVFMICLPDAAPYAMIRVCFNISSALCLLFEEFYAAYALL